MLKLYGYSLLSRKMCLVICIESNCIVVVIESFRTSICIRTQIGLVLRSMIRLKINGCKMIIFHTIQVFDGLKQMEVNVGMNNSEIWLWTQECLCCHWNFGPLLTINTVVLLTSSVSVKMLLELYNFICQSSGHRTCS